MKACVAIITLCLVPLALGAEELTYVDLLSRLTDLERLALLPQEGEQCAQWSSWERSSVYDEATGKYVKWDANGDGDGSIREEDGKLVMAEMEGPGCIWRIWSARPEDGHVRIYLDGASEPAVDLPFKGYFNGEHEPFNLPSLVYESAKGMNCYVPIPYQKSCRIVADPGWGRYYHFTYGTFPKGSRVPSFTREPTPVEELALNEADAALSACGPRRVRNDNEAVVVKKSVTVKPGKKAEVLEIEGAQAILSIRAKLNTPLFPAEEFWMVQPGQPVQDIRDREKLPQRIAQRDMLRELALSIAWDDEKEPSVWSPLGDFFGTAAGANVYRSLPTGLTEAGTWYSNWFMPFAEEAEIMLFNDGDEPRTVEFEVVYAPLKKDIARYGRFHAKWHRDALLPEEPERAIDWTMLKTDGRGRFCGVMLHVWNPRGGWWGEGDEKFFVDGEKFPSTFGTGSEDYFGYAWCNPTLFTRPYHNQTISMGNRGHVSVNRWHIADDVPFQTSFEGAIEKYYANDRPCLYAAVAYWYLAPDGCDPYGPVPVAERVDYYRPESDKTKVPGAIDGEDMAVLGKSAGNAQAQGMTGFEGVWSQNTHLWWTGARPGDALDLALPVQKAGNYKIVASFTKARDYGIVQLHLDGKKLGRPIDLYNPTVRPHGPFDLGTVELEGGQHKLTVEILGANPQADERFMFGLDYVKLEPVG